jgi:uncharacterized repeat protein (TIGR03803 family)
MKNATSIHALVAVGVLVLGLLNATPAFARKDKVLYAFCPCNNDGNTPFGAVIFDALGNVYGTTYEGGTNGGGTVFELSPRRNGSWKETVLYNFGGAGDGYGPQYSLNIDRSGNLYGTTIYGGIGAGGTVFELSHGEQEWTEEVLHSFSNGSEEFYAVGTPVFDKAGNLYGTTEFGSSHAYGTVYELSPSGGGQWNVTVLHIFAGGSDGAYPASGVIFDGAGNLYGTTGGGGSSNDGTVFELTPSGNGQWKETILHTFSGADGAYPSAGLIFDQVGNLYGVTDSGGINNDGTVYQLSPGANDKWSEKVLRSFRGLPKYSTATLVFDKRGSLYGTTEGGGSTGCDDKGCGMVFKLTPDSNGTWTYQVVHIFHQNGKDGNIPIAGVVVDSSGKLYGTTFQGGTGICNYNDGCGTVFEITP